MSDLYDDTEDLGEDNEQDLDTDSQESDGADDTAADDAPPASQDSSDTESKRIRDLTSKWQKAEAARAKAEAALAKSRSKQEPAQSNAQADEFMDFAKEHARNTLYASDPRFSKYGIGVEDITGDTPAQMQASVARQRKMIDTLESAIRNEVMLEHGLDADVTSTSTNSIPDIGGMSQEDFQKLMRRRDSLR